MNTKVSPARSAAFDILWRVANDDAYASNLLASGSHNDLSREDHALLQELVLGVLRWQSRLDFLIERYARRKLNKLDAEAVISLRLGLYQLKFLSRVPPHAAINESVNLVKEHKKLSAASLVNAVLRSAQRDSQFSFEPARFDQAGQAENDPPVKPSIVTSHPAWLLNRWIARYGETEAREMAMANNTAPRTAFRFNPRRQSEDRTRAWLAEHNIEICDSALTPQAFVIKHGNLSWRSAPVREGWIYLQDEASQLVARLAAHLLRDGEASKVWDVCAAPGSKTTLLASLLKKGSLIVASDFYDHRLRTMQELNNKLGFDQIKLVQLDATQEAPSDTDSSWPESFDLVLLDAPCSGLGTLQRHPEIKWKMAEAKLGELAELQKRLLSNAARRVNEGGLLVYSVCSTEPEEGEQIIEWFRAENPGFRDVTRERLMELGIDPLPLLTASFGARTYTHRQGTESFFFCVLWKRQGKIDSMSYVLKRGLNVPAITVIDESGRVIADEQRRVFRHLAQNGYGADEIFGVGTTGEWNRLSNSERQRVMEIEVDEVRCINSEIAACHPQSAISTQQGPQLVEAWVGLNGKTRAEVLSNLDLAIQLGVDAAVIAPLAIEDLDEQEIVRFFQRDVNNLLESALAPGREMPIFLYDNADIAAAGHAPHVRTQIVKHLSRLPWVRGIKVSASRRVIGNYTKAALHYKQPGEFGIYIGNAMLIFEMYRPSHTFFDRLREGWRDYLLNDAVPIGVISGPGNCMPREWQKAWRACWAGDEALTNVYQDICERFESICGFEEGGERVKKTIACVKYALEIDGVLSSSAVGNGTKSLTADQKAIFKDRYLGLREYVKSRTDPLWQTNDAQTVLK